MGIKGGASLISSNSNILTTNLSKLPKKTRVCVDASEFIYRSLIKQGDNHVSGCLNLLEKLFRHGILPLFIFDGYPPKEKQYVIDERRKTRVRAREKLTKIAADNEALQKVYDTIVIDSNSNTIDSNTIESLSSSLSEEDYQTLISTNSELIDDTLIKSKLTAQLTTNAENAERERRKTISLADKQIQDIKSLLDLFGIPYMTLGLEADIICAKLVKYGFVDYCISNDVDLLAFGCSKIIRNLKFRDDDIEIFDYAHIMRDMKLTHAQFVDLSIILGCDYAPRIIGIKASLALSLIKTYGTIEGIIENINTINAQLEAEEPGKFIKIPEQFDYQSARNIFNDETITYDMLKEAFDENNFSTIELVCRNNRNSSSHYKAIFAYCREHCHCLNDSLIYKKINTVINCFNNESNMMNKRPSISNAAKDTNWRSDIYEDIRQNAQQQHQQHNYKPQRPIRRNNFIVNDVFI